MRHKHILACTCCILCMASCQNESEKWSSPTTELTMSVIAHIGEPSSPKSRYAGPDLNNVEFTQGDSIGIFIDDAPITRWGYSNISWVPDEKTYWPDKVNAHTFRAFYPYVQADSYNSITMPSLLDQDGSFESLSNHDFLAATTTQTYGENGTVYFQGKDESFKHISSLIYLILNADEDLISATINRISLEGTNIVAPSTYSFTDGVTLTPNAQSNLLEITNEKSMSNGDVEYYLITNEKPESTGKVTLTIEYSVGEQTYTAQATDFSNNTFVKGMQHRFSITVKNRALVISGSSITPWDESVMQDIIIDAKESES